MKVLNLLVSGRHGGIETLCNNIDKYGDIDNYWIFLFSGGEIANEMKQRNEDKVFLLGYSKIQLLKFINKINNICKEKEIDIINIHHESLYGNIIYCLLKKYNPNIKFVRTLHSCYEDKYNLGKGIIKDKIILYYKKIALQKSDLIVGVSNAVVKSYEDKFDIKNIKKTVIYNGISNKFFETEAKNKVKKEIIYVGRLEKVKGVDILIKAIGILKNDKLHLTIVGDGSERQNLENLVSKLKITDFVTFEGKQNNVINWLDRAEIFVYPSVWEEAFGISVVEAMARNCIPITFNKGGLPEIIKDEENGFIVKKIDEEYLANKIKYVIEIENKEKIIKNIKNTAKKFSINSTIENLKEAYSLLLN